MLLSSCFLLVACLFVTEKNVVVGKKKEGLGIEKKEIFCCLGGAFSLKKDGIRSRKKNKIRSKRYRLLIVFALLSRRIFLELKRKRRGAGIYKVMCRVVIAVLLCCNLNAFAV